MMMSNIRMVEAKLPPGFRFHPRDEELVCDYLLNKLTPPHSHSSLFIDLHLNNCEPWDIPETASVGGKQWYFYTQRDRKYATGVRTNRATASGYWKATGKDRAVLRKGKLVGMRKTLVFYQGRAPKGKKTNWVMHEFRIQPHPPQVSSPKEDWVLCRVFYKKREEIVKGSMGSSYDEYTGTGIGCSSSLPQLMDSYISFEQPAAAAAPAPADDDDDHCEQVPCFSNNLFSHHHHHHHQINNNNTVFDHMMTMDHPNLVEPKNDNNNIDTTTVSTYGGGGGTTTDTSSTCFDPFSCDTKVLKAMLTHLTKMEPNPITHNHPTQTHDHLPSHTNNYFSHLSIPTLWNHF